MKRILVLLAVLLAVFVLIMACVSQPKPEEPKITPAPTPVPTPPPPPPPQIIEHKTSDFGGAVPDWVSKTVLDLEAEPTFKDQYVFIEDHAGKDLQGVKTWAKSFNAQDAIAAMVATRVKSKFVGALAGDANMVETYMEKVVKTVSQAEFSGMRVVEDFWVKKRYFTNTGEVEKEEYRYLFLITVPRQSINDAINRALDGNKPETKEEITAVDRVKEAWGEGI